MPISPEFYRPPRHSSPGSLLILAAAAAVSCLLAPVYSAFILFAAPVYVRPLFLIAFALATGWAARLAAYHTHTLNSRLAGLLALAGGLVGFHLSWSAWLSLLIISRHLGDPGLPWIIDYLKTPASWTSFALHPSELLGMAKEVMRQGVWGIGLFGAGTIKGALLAAAWAAELLLFAILVLRRAGSPVMTPYSKEIGCYLPRLTVLHRGFLMPNTPAQLGTVCGAISKGDLTYFVHAPTVAGGEPGFYLSFRYSSACPWGTVDAAIARRGGASPGLDWLVRNVMLPYSMINSLIIRLD
ncbi:MAG: hypothetical protein LBG06_06750 [Deltaproteobacteria bacterium]|jgi:hypothetical protein|nr:hypothetical protein [Deltaproteobacteria bacterium]